MNSERKTAYWVGGLYVVATVAGVAAIGPWNTLVADQGILVNAAAHENQLFLAGLLYLVMAVAVAGVAFMIYPVLRRVAQTAFEQGMAPNHGERAVPGRYGWIAGDAAPHGGYLETLSGLLGLLASGDLEPVVAEQVPLVHGARAHALLESGGHAGKVVLVCGPPTAASGSSATGSPGSLQAGSQSSFAKVR